MIKKKIGGVRKTTVKVKATTRKTKKGKKVVVKAHTRSLKGGYKVGKKYLHISQSIGDSYALAYHDNTGKLGAGAIRLPPDMTEKHLERVKAVKLDKKAKYKKPRFLVFRHR